MANAIAREMTLSVGLVFAIGLIDRSEILQHILSFHFQEGPNQTRGCVERTNARHAAKTRQTRAAKNVMQDGLDLVVGRMGRCHISGAVCFGRLSQKAVSRLASNGFDASRRCLGHLGMPHNTGEAKSTTKLDD